MNTFDITIGKALILITQSTGNDNEGTVRATIKKAYPFKLLKWVPLDTWDLEYTIYLFKGYM